LSTLDHVGPAADVDGEPDTQRITELDGAQGRSAAPTEPQPIVPVLGSDRYVVRELIAKGGMGEVHLAWDRLSAMVGEEVGRRERPGYGRGSCPQKAVPSP
jgi:hypothetical protein